ncbi:MAG: hypothetical protein R3F34_09110 [Planctomycetota bacterium]
MSVIRLNSSTERSAGTSSGFFFDDAAGTGRPVLDDGRFEFTGIGSGSYILEASWVGSDGAFGRVERRLELAPGETLDVGTLDFGGLGRLALDVRVVVDGALVADVSDADAYLNFLQRPRRTSRSAASSASNARS